MTIPPNHRQHSAPPSEIDTLTAEVSRLRVEGHISHDHFEQLFALLNMAAQQNEWR